MNGRLLANWLIPGDVIVHNNRRIVVQTIERCPSSRKGIPKYHVNKSLCVDSIAPLEVHYTKDRNK